MNPATYAVAPEIILLPVISKMKGLKYSRWTGGGDYHILRAHLISLPMLTERLASDLSTWNNDTSTSVNPTSDTKRWCK